MAELGEGLSGYLDVQDATLRAPRLEAVSNIGIANTAPQHAFSVGSNLYVDTESSNVLTVKGNVVTEGIKMGFIEITPSYDFAAVSNVGNVTANVIQFANATTGFVTTANVEIGGNITLTANAQVKVGSNVLAEYTGPHGREPTTPLLKKYPEIVFDASKYDHNHSTNTYVQAGYTVTASSQQLNGYKIAAKLYNEQFPIIIDNNDGWQGGNNAYDGSTGVATSLDTLTGITGATSSRDGSYTTLELPHKIKLSYLQIHTRNSVDNNVPLHPKQVYVYGSNDGSSWTQVGSHLFTSVPATAIWQRIDINSTTPYKYFALQATSILPFQGTSLNRVYILDLEWYGYEEPAPVGDLSLDTTLKSTFNSVRSNNYVMYFDGEGFDPNDTNSNNLVTGSSVSVVHHNATYDTTEKYWTLDGSTESNVTTGSLGLVGDAPHTVSTWINASNLEANATTQQLFSIGSGYSEEIVRVDDTQIAANTWHNVTYAYQGEGGSKVTYVDGRKVEEAQVEDTFGEYPPFDMTDYEVGGYRVSVSSAYIESTYRPFSAFNDGGTDINNVWHSTPSYTGTSSEYVGDVRLAANVDPGHWIKLETPHKLQVSYVNLVARPPSGATNLETQAPKDFQVCGSNDDVNWDVLASFTGEAPQDDGTSNYTVNAQRGYKYLALAVNKAVNSTSVTIANIKFYGHKEGDLTRFPEPTRVLKYPHVAMTGPAQRGYVVSASSDQSQYSLDMWKAFDGVKVSGNGWASQDGTYYDGTSPANSYTGTTHQLGTGTAYGEWLKLELPHKIKVTKFILYADPGVSYGTDEAPKSYKVYGSVSGSSWTEIKDVSNETPSTSGNSHDVTDTTAYKYLGIVVTQVNTNQDNIRIGELEYYGTEEDTGTPAIVGGPFAGKVANFRVYDKYLGDERIQEIYDAQKDTFGHKKSSMTLYKGRVGVGTTEPEGALTVLDEPHALAKFPARAVSADDSYVEGDGQIKLSAVEGSGYQAFDGLTSTSWTATPTRNTRLSEEVDFGAWLKLQTPESISLKKAEIESNPYWRQVGATFQGAGAGYNLGSTVACNKDGTRIAIAEPASGGSITAPQDGRVRIYDWNGTAWTQVGQSLTGAQSDYYGVGNMGFSDDGSRFITSSPNDGTPGGGSPNAGVVEVYYLSGGTWTLVGNPFTSSAGDDQVGKSCAISGDGNTIAFVDYQYDDATIGVNAGRTRAFTWNGTTWVQKGSDMFGDVAGDGMGRVMEMTSDGNYVIIGNYSAGSNNGKVWVYAWDGSDWVKRGNTLVGTGADLLGFDVTISDDANTIAIGENHNDVIGTEAGAVEIRTWNGSAYVLTHTLYDPEATSGRFGSAVALSGDGTRLVAVTHHYPAGSNSAHGRARVFEYNGTSWELRIPVTSIGALGNQGTDGSGSALGQEDGLAISRDGSVIVVGLPNDDTSGNANSGQVKVFHMPSNIKSIWGSNDDVNWTKITTGNETFRVTDRLEFKNLDNPNYYKYHAIVGDAFTRLKDIKLYGIRNQGSSTLHDGTLTLTKNLDVPRIGPPPDADDTPRRDRLVVEYNTSTNPLEDGMVKDTSGRGNDGVFVGTASYDTTQKAFTFPGTAGNYITRSQIGNSAGAWVHSFSLWVNTNDLSYNHIFSIGADSDNDTSTFRYDAGPGGNAFKWFFYGNDVNFTYSTAIDVWLHVVGVYDGGSVAGSRRLWVNGVESVQSSSSGIEALTLTANTQLTLGERSNRSGTQTLNGEISNFKLYDCALTAQEVKTLYDMGRCSNAIPKTLHIMGGMMRYNNDINRLQIHNGVKWFTIGGISATGGTVTYTDGYAIHTFTSSGTFTVTAGGGDVEYLMVAGGGGGSNTFYCGGGGAGGMLTGTTTINAGSYIITVGGGGATGTIGTIGGDSQFNALTANGGGGGGGVNNAGTNGGSGGGGGYAGGAGVVGAGMFGGTGLAGQGNNGGRGNGYPGYGWGGGGGGAGTAGTTAQASPSVSVPGDGGDGVQSSITGTATYYAGGAGGRIDSAYSASGGLGGGGSGGTGSNADGTAGGTNTGGGGGPSKAGGSGIVIIRYLV